MAPVDLTIILLTLLLPLLWYFRESLPIVGGKAKKITTTGASKKREEEGDPRDFVAKMERGVSPILHRYHLLRL
jgi:NADPH-ferrihemoprotein reductase